MREEWSKPVDQLRVGDVVRRDITLTAVGVSADQMQAPEHGRTQGITVVEASLVANTQITGKGVIGTIRRSWDLKIERGGVVYISPVGAAYWHPEQRVRLKAAVPGYRLEPLPADRQALAAALMQEAHTDHASQQVLGLVVAAVLALPLIVGLGLFAWAAVPTRADWRLLHQCRLARSGANPESEIYRAVQSWRRTNPLGEGAKDIQPQSLAYLAIVIFGKSGTIYAEKNVSRYLIRAARNIRVLGLRRMVKFGIVGIIGASKPL
jgi:hypothetical protein